MPSTVTIHLTNRSPNKPIKNLPGSIDADPTTTVEDAKIMIARAAGIADHNQIGLFDPNTNKTLKNRKAAICEEDAVTSAGKVQVKDLGPQIAWQTVFILEYLGPILFHFLVLGLRPWLYRDASEVPLSSTQKLGFFMFVGHFLKREYETLFVHKFSASTMPVRNIVKNCFFYWAFTGALCAWEIYAPWSFAAKAQSSLIDVIGTVIFVFSEVSNGLVHLNLASLRSTGGTERKVPKGFGFNLVTCPNYMFEILSWVGVIIAMRSWATAIFILFGAAQMFAWAKGKEKAYRKEFPETYKKKKFVILPGLM